MRANPSRSHTPRSVTSSPSSRYRRVSPVGSVSGSLPRRVSSSRHPRDSRSRPDTVPLPSRSPGRRLQPLLAWCVSICAAVQYISRKLVRLSRAGAIPSSRMRGVRSHASSRTSIPPCSRSAGDVRYGSGSGSPAGRAYAGTRKGASASIVTTQGETVVAKLLERNGPSGRYSQLCTSRADQSFRSPTPKR